MSTFGFSTKKCTVCGKEQLVKELRSTNAFGSPDLDLRPPEMERSTMHFWVEQCAYCGYAAPDIAKDTDITEEWLKTYALPKSEKLNTKSVLAKCFYCAFLISQEENNSFSAFNHALYAAWSCDDAKETKNAAFFRKAALEELEKIDDESKADPDSKILLKADLLRRCGCFDEVSELLQDISFSNETGEKIRLFQLEKAKEKDDKCYTVEDATCS